MIARCVAALLILLLSCVSSLTVCLAADDAPQPQSRVESFPLRDGDVWVMVGDSITWQNLYTVYLESFVRARYPKLRIAIVNSGRSGEVYIQGIVRFRESIAAYQPTLVTMAYGMNDHTKIFPGDQNFVEDPRSAPQRLIDSIRSINARPMVFSSSPLIAPPDYATDGGTFRLTGQNTDAKSLPASWRSNVVIKSFAERVESVALRNTVPFVDARAPLQLLWAECSGPDRVAALRRAVSVVVEEPITDANFAAKMQSIGNVIKPFVVDAVTLASAPLPEKEEFLAQWRAMKSAKAPAWENYRQYLQRWVALVDKMNPRPVQISGYTASSRALDIIHPNEAGHLHIALVWFKLLGGDGLVSDAVIDARSAKVERASKTVISNVSFDRSVLAFDRLDESLPLPIDKLAQPGSDIDVNTPLGNPKNLMGMSRLMTTVRGLPGGTYRLAIDGQAVAEISSAELERGFDAGLLRVGPIAEQTQRLLAAVTSQCIRAIDENGKVKAAERVTPRTFAEAEPVKRRWTLTPIQTP